MQMKKRRHCLSLVAALFLLLGVRHSKANVYATNIKIDGALTNGWVAPGFPAQISYILNEPASAGVQMEILAGSNVIRSFSATNGQPGTLAGSNAFSWDGTDSRGSNVAPALYSVQITAAASGYSDWTNINAGASNFYVFFPRGIDVNKNTNSLFYGRVFVSNPNPPDVGIYKFNADGSPADEGAFGSGEWGWAGNFYSPWKISIGFDDAVYIDDWAGQGTVPVFDQTIGTNLQIAVASDAYPTNTAVELSGIYVTGHADNQELWATDFEPGASSLGVFFWTMTNDIVPFGGDTNGLNLFYAISVTNSDLVNVPYDLAVASNRFIYVIQKVIAPDPSVSAVLCFPPWTNGAPAETKALWAVGADDTNYVNAYGIDVSPDGLFVAVAVRGQGTDSESLTNGNLTILSAANGTLVRRFSMTNDFEGNGSQFADVAWDRVGNLYALDAAASMCRVYSPPGPNQATTVGIEKIEVLSSLQAPQLSEGTLTTNGFGLWLHGQPDVGYVVQLSTDLLSWTNVATNFDTAADRFITLPSTADTQDFYRAVVLR